MAEIEDKKKEVAPLEKVPKELGPTTIFCDPNLESSLQFETNQKRIWSVVGTNRTLEY